MTVAEWEYNTGVSIWKEAVYEAGRSQIEIGSHRDDAGGVKQARDALTSIPGLISPEEQWRGTLKAHGIELENTSADLTLSAMFIQFWYLILFLTYQILYFLYIKYQYLWFLTLHVNSWRYFPYCSVAVYIFLRSLVEGLAQLSHVKLFHSHGP